MNSDDSTSTRSSVDTDDDPIVGFRKPTNRTSPDYRHAFSLNANDLRILRLLCKHVEEDEFNTAVLIMLLGVAKLRDRAVNEEMLEEGIGGFNIMEVALDNASSSSTSTYSFEIEVDEFLNAELDNMDINLDDLGMQGVNTNDLDLAVADEVDSLRGYLDDSSDLRTFDENSLSSTSVNLNPCATDLIWELIKNDYPKEMYGQMNSIEFSELGEYDEILCFTASVLGVSLIDLDNVCKSIFDLTAIRSSDWDEVQLSTKSPKKNRRIEDWNDVDARAYLLFSTDELRHLKNHLFDSQPTDSFTWNDHKFTYEETLLIACDYMANATKYQRMKDTFGGNWTNFSGPVNFFARYLHQKYYNRLSGDSLHYWAPWVPKFREQLWKWVCFDDDGNKIDGINVPFDEFGVFGWIDCNQNETCRPGGGPINDNDDRRPEENQIQRAFFSSYGKLHGMKSQALYGPNGMYLSMYFSSISPNDKGVVNLSGIEGALKEALENYKTHDNRLYPKMYGDAIYDQSETCMVANGVDSEFIRRLTSSRGDVEHVFGLTSNLFKRGSAKHTWELLKMKKYVKAHLFSLFFMTNCFSCFRGNKTTAKYGFDPFPLEQYLDVGYEDGYHEDDGDAYMEEHVQYN